ncbi:MAG: alcohol dehydrogenase catalytic domain-containing protein [Kiritimatiellae bacterium]|nr:alcohol dehydrogenase catalytic domain-containing protein [Kiritimatiellia bacterium]
MANETMRVSVCVAPGVVEIQRRPVPVPSGSRILVRVRVCGICGSDLAVWKPCPYTPGHEYCATVVARGADARRFEVGQRVVIDPNLGCGICDYCLSGRPNLCDALKTRDTKSNGGLADYVALDEHMAHALPDALPDELAPFVEPLSCALHAARVAATGQPGRAVVMGAGTMGFLTALALKDLVPEVLVADPADNRREQARDLLGVRAMAPCELTEAFADAAIDCSGRLDAVVSAIRFLRKGGSLVMAGLVTEAGEARFPWEAITTRELTLRGVWLNPRTFADAICLAVARRDVLGRLTTAVYDLDRVAEAFRGAARQEAQKVLVRP